MIDQTDLTFLVFVVLVALVFELSNGFNDAANAIATVVSTRVMSPLAAVLMAAVMNLLGAISGTAVAKTVGKGVVDPAILGGETACWLLREAPQLRLLGCSRQLGLECQLAAAIVSSREWLELGLPTLEGVCSSPTGSSRSQGA